MFLRALLVGLVVLLTTGAYLTLARWCLDGMPWPGSTRTKDDDADFKTVGAVAVFTVIVPVWLVSCCGIVAAYITFIKG